VSTGIVITSSDGECSITPPSAAFEFNFSAQEMIRPPVRVLLLVHPQLH
jgi:hypothetical protein